MTVILPEGIDIKKVKVESGKNKKSFYKNPLFKKPIVCKNCKYGDRYDKASRIFCLLNGSYWDNKEYCSRAERDENE